MEFLFDKLWVKEDVIYNCLLIGMFIMAPLTAAVLLYFKAPYGRYAESGWGPTLPARLGWIFMESPATIILASTFSLDNSNIGAWILLLMWEIHYIHRAFIFPFRISEGSPMPLLVVALGGLFNLCNGYLHGRWFTYFMPNYDVSWLCGSKFIIGSVIFLTGKIINILADRVLMNLRTPGDKGYYIPQGGLFRLVSCPNYFGEILEWFGWAIATWSLPGLAFATFTLSSLTPRALDHHQWYQKKFEDYPKKRRALFPYLL